MYRHSFITAFALSCLLFASCERFRMQGPGQEGISFTLEQDSAPVHPDELVGIFIGSPLRINNASASLEGGTIVPFEKLRWGSDQKDSSAVFIYAPYTEALDSNGVVNLPIGSDFRVASFKCSPKCANPIPVRLIHSASRIVLYVDSKNVESIDSVSLSAAYRNILVIGASGSVATGGKKVRVQMEKIGEQGSVSAWSALVAPQKANFSIIVKAGDRLLESELGESADLKAGMQYQNSKIICPGIGDKLHRTILQPVKWAETAELDWNYIDDSAPRGNVSSIIALSSADGADFSFNVKNVTVSYMKGDIVHLEDSTGAIRVNAHGHGLFMGNTLTGELSGTVQTVDRMPTVTKLVTEYLDIVSGSEPPIREMSLPAVVDSFDLIISRRLLIKGIEFVEALSESNPVAKIMQEDLLTGEKSFSYVYSAHTPINIPEGKFGNIECFPGIYNGRNVLFLYDSSLFTELSRPQRPIEYTPFTLQCTEPGLYLNTASSANAVYAFRAIHDQMVMVSGARSRGFRLQSLADRRFLSVTIPSVQFTVGEIYTADIATFGIEGFNTSSCDLKAVMSQNGNVWLSGDGIGIIFKSE